MADIFRIVQLPDPKRPVVLLDIGDNVTYFPWRDPPLTITPPAKRPIVSQSSRRYGGGRTVGESHENGTLSRKIRVRGTTPDGCLAAVEAILAQTESFVGKYIEWRPQGASRSTYFELRGSAAWTPTYQWVQFSAGLGLDLDLVIPIAPLARRDAMDIWDDFAVDSSSDWTFEFGAGTLTWDTSIGQLVPATTAAKKMYHTGRGYRYGEFEATWQFRTGATIGGGRDVRVGKRIDANNYLYAIVGVSNVGMFAQVAGATTGVGTLTGSVTIATNTTYWIRFRIEQDTAYAELFTSEPTPRSTPAATVTYAMSAPHIALFGSAQLGDDWLQLSGLDNDWRIDEHHCRPYTYRMRALPDILKLKGPVPGNAPALMDVEVTVGTAGAPFPRFGKVGWAPRPRAPASGSVAPWGIIEAESDDSAARVGFTVRTDANYRGGSGLSITTSGAGSATAEWFIDPTTLPDDDFIPGEYDVDVYARIELDSDIVGPRLTLSEIPETVGLADENFTAEFGSVGKALVPEALTSPLVRFRYVRLGSLRLDSEAGLRLKLRLVASWGIGSSGRFGIDYLDCTMLRRTASTPTGKVNDSTYPQFVKSTHETTKTITHDLRGLAASPPSLPVRDHGMGGAQIEPPPGDLDVYVKLSNAVPDDPTLDPPFDTNTEVLSHTATVHCAITPRDQLVRGS